ncbi:Clathrin light chain [Coemansia aciculifera]|uniref:Clathrin light chain n=1 Tax=Coemansia aciculifera TaxID=417176 RepID=A0ACC1M9B5_9FUNG|nr:Clathrin light chain [Coemansia aciculifera]
MSDEYDPTADFLAQERAALGEAADFFQVSDVPTPQSQQPTPSFTTSDSFVATPSIATTHSDKVFGITTTTDENRIQSPAPSSSRQQESSMSPKPIAVSSEFEQQWQGKQREIVDDRDRTAAAKHETMVQEAQQAIDRFYEEYNEKKDRAIEENRANQEIELQAASKGELWERVVKQIDLATKASQDQKTSAGNVRSPPTQQQQQQQPQQQGARDTSRMRELLQDLKRDPEAPGAKPKKTATAA